MRRQPVRVLFAWSLFAAGLLAFLSGCGTSEYRRLVAERLDHLRTSAPFRILFDKTHLTGTPVNIRVPMAFGKSYILESAHADDGAKVNPARLQPPFLKLPGFRLCYEGTINDAQNPANGKVPFYCYLAAEPATPAEAEKVGANLLVELKKTFKDAPAEWDPINVYDPVGKGLPWKKVRVVGEQPFLCRGDQKVESKNLPGIFELWMYAEQGYMVLVGWRTPSSVDGPSPTGAASQTPLQAAANGKPDLSAMPALTAGTLTLESPEAAGG